MSYKIKGTPNDGGESFYVDGSKDGKSFAVLEDAIDYAHRYARAVGEVSYPEPTSEPGWFVRATKADGYAEDIRIESSERGSAMVGFLAVSAFFVVVASGFADLVARLVTLR